MAAYAYHAGVLGYTDEAVNEFIAKALFAIGEDWGMTELLPIVLRPMEILPRSQFLLWSKRVPSS